MVIHVDTREKPRAIVRIMKTFDADGVEVVRRALPFGDYINPARPGIVIDRKQTLIEVASNLVQDRVRFLREVDRANRLAAKAALGDREALREYVETDPALDGLDRLYCMDVVNALIRMHEDVLTKF